ncbi:MAG: putative flippase GtrA [Verrucomicrobiales bacterium]|jgi:putative flippase GtrA
MISMIREGLDFYRKNDLKTCWKAFIKRDTHPFLQFVKYGFCGVFAVFVHSVVFALLEAYVFPVPSQEEIAKMTEAGTSLAPVGWNFFWASFGGFLASDVAAYYTNLKIVFTGGRHNRVLEFLFFTGVALIGFTAGLILAELQLLYGFGDAVWATATLVVTAALVNFACRKLFIFKG